MNHRFTRFLALLGVLLEFPASAIDHQSQGYSYLSPLPQSQYCSTSTRFVLVRFVGVSPSELTNLATFITVTGASSGQHSGTTHIAGDGRTVIFTMSKNFAANEVATVSLNPGFPAGVGSAVLPYQYQFVMSTHMPAPGAITARGDVLPGGSKTNAFDNLAATKWMDQIVPNGSGSFSWIQAVYPAGESRVVNQYAITSASDYPERDPKDWRFYGVDQSSNLVLLDSRAGQSFSARGQKIACTFSNSIAFRGYRLEITRIANPATATAVQLAELQFREPQGTLLREVWTGIAGSSVFDLTTNARFPNSPNLADQITVFEAPVNWAEDYGTRIRGYITAPATGEFTFWIASDDNSQLWLSTNASPANKRLIARVPGWTDPRQWAVHSEQKSAPVSLIAGNQYYVEALQKEQGGGDNIAVGWAKPGEPTTAPSEVIPGSVLTPWTGAAPVAISAQSFEPQPSAGQPVMAASSSGTASGDPGTPTLQGLGYPVTMPNGVSVPSDFPQINITLNDNPDPRHIFIDTRGGGGKPYNVIFDNSGSPVWYQLMPDERRDMKVQPNGMLTMLARTGGYRFVGLNSNYVEVATYRAVNGYDVDEHELFVQPDGTYFLIGLASQAVDMSRYIVGGKTAASVTEQVVQGFTPAGELIFQWRAWDHLDILDQHQFIDITGNGFDFPHINAIYIDFDGHILISSRNTSEITKINRETGEIIWRLGGLSNQFTYINDPLAGPANQHAISAVATNRYLLFDNGNLHNPSVSRSVEYLVNTTNMTATVVWQYPATPTTSLFSHYMANTQRLTNGNTLINWAVGHLPKLTEVRPNGSKAFEMNWADGYEAYRVWRCAWQGLALNPNLIIEPYPDRLTLIFNKFGDTNVAYYRIYGGTTPTPTNVLATSPVTMTNLRNLQNQTNYYFRVTAVSPAGAESAFSEERSVFVNITRPGQNLVVNGDFALGTNSWTWTTNGTARAVLSVVNGAAFVDVTSPGAALSDIQLRQAGLQVYLGTRYILAFDAWSAAPRTMEVRVAKDQDPFTGYKTAAPSLTPTRRRFSYPFTMVNATDTNARLVFNLGVSSIDVYIDNVVFTKAAPGDLNEDGYVNFSDLSVFTGQWLKQGSGFSADFAPDQKIDFKDFGVLGQTWSGQ